MKMTKRKVLKTIIKDGGCTNLYCDDCPYTDKQCVYQSSLVDKLVRIGAMALLRQNYKKREFDKSKILTSVTADQAKVGMRGYFADTYAKLKCRFEANEVYELVRIHEEDTVYRFATIGSFNYALFYPIDEEE